MPAANAVRPLAHRRWVELLPWLDGYRSGPSILSENELIPNAWISTSPAQSLTSENFDAFCTLVAARYVADRPDHRLAADFPHAEHTGHRLDRTVNQLLGTPGTERSAVAEIVRGLVASTAVAGDAPSADDALPVPLTDDRRVREFVDGLDDRDRLILAERIVTSQPRTQAHLASQIGLSRERVNQLDRSLRLQLTEMVEASATLRPLLSEMSARANPIADVSDVIADIPELGLPFPTLDIPLWRILGAGSGELHIADDWIVKGSVQEANTRIREVLDEYAGPESVVPLAPVAQTLMLSVETTARWLGRNGFAVIGDHVVTASSATGDLVAATLSIAGAPLTFDEIVDSMADTPRSRSSIRNAITTDDRIVKTDRTTYGLVRWGGERYLPVHRQIGAILDEVGGQIGIDDLISRIMAKYNVTESSIRAYAGAGEFITRDDVVSRREKRYVNRKSPTKTRNLYRDGDIVRWRSVVSKAHIKGSAFNIPSALAGHLGVGPGKPLQLPSRLGPQSIIWVSVQGRLGTVKRFIDDLGLTEGDEIFLEFAPQQFDVRPYRPRAGAEPAQQILAMLGRPDHTAPDAAQLREILISSLWLPEDADIPTVIDTLRHRREDTLAELVSLATGPSQPGADTTKPTST